MPVSVDVAAATLSISPQEVMAEARVLVAAGRLTESPAGYELTGAAPEVSPASAAYLAGHLANALSSNGGEPRHVGRLLRQAGQFAGAWKVLSSVALDPDTKLIDSERIEVLESGLACLVEARLDGGATEGQLRLQLARLYRSRGQTVDARALLEVAITKLSGDDLIQALGFMASVEDDAQHPQEAERWVALAETVAAQHHSHARLASLITFHGRELSRLGFAAEAEATVAKGVALLEQHGSPAQRFYGRLNQAWIDLDQGQMRKAEMGFARLKDEAGALEGEASQATQEAYWARALFGVGDPAQAEAALERASAKARQLGATAALFIAHLARAEGGILFEKWDRATEGASDALDISIQAMPSWENVCRYLRARALLGAGRREEAGAEVEAALAATPPGSNGLRWRSRIEELALELAPSWDQQRAEDLTDLLLQSRWLGGAVELMTARARRENDPDLASEAAALAIQIGNPIQAAKAIEAGNLWSDPIALPVAAALRPIRARLPQAWQPDVLTSPAAEAALATEVEAGEEETALLRERIDQALSSAGLSGDMILSPAQRRSAGLVRRRPVRRRRGPLQVIGTAAAMVVVAVVASLAVVNLTTPPTTTATTATTATTLPPMEETLIAAPEAGLSGNTVFRGDPARSGVGIGGISRATGIYWLPRLPGGTIVRPPVARGAYLFVPTEENLIHVIQQRNGNVDRQIETERISSLLAVGQPSTESDVILVYVGESGTLNAHSAFSGSRLWSQPVGEVESAPLIVGDSVYVASSDGHLYSFVLAGGQLQWQYPAGDATASFATSPAYADGVIYMAASDGLVHSIDAVSGEATCEPVDTRFGITENPVVAGGVVFVGLEGGSVRTYAAGTCWSPAAGYATDYPVSMADGAIITSDTLYYVEDRILFAASLAPDGWIGATPFLWPQGFTDDELITTPPILADGLIYLGTNGGYVYAVDAVTGEEAWRFNAGAPLRYELVVVERAVFATTANGQIIAIAGE